jgi:NAD(P)H-dependent FMN reductase
MPKVLLLAASMRRDSCNKKLIHVVEQQLSANAICEFQLLNFADFSAPLYNGDVEESNGIPENIDRFVQALKQASGLIIASPEYNYSIPGTLKNLIDWVSRVKPMPFARKPILLLSASPSLAGGSRGLLATEVTLLACGAFVFPRTFSLSNAYDAFDENMHLKDQKLLDSLVKCLVTFVKTLN